MFADKKVQDILRNMELKELESLLVEYKPEKINSSEWEKSDKLDGQIAHLLKSLSSTAEIDEKRRELIKNLTVLLQQHWSDIRLELFGSVASSIGTMDSDLDICCFGQNFSDEQSVVKKFNQTGEQLFYHQQLAEILREGEYFCFYLNLNSGYDKYNRNSYR
jgi:DNA polymerase sigma